MLGPIRILKLILIKITENANPILPNNAKNANPQAKPLNNLKILSISQISAGNQILNISQQPGKISLRS